MAQDPTWDENTLARLNDEDLVLLAQRQPALQAAAAGILAVRLQKRFWPLVSRAARRRGLTLQDAEDASQEIYFWILPAIPRYEPVRANKHCRVCTYLRSVVASHGGNYLERARRLREKVELSVDLSTIPDSQAKRADTNPATLAENQEPLHRVGEALTKVSTYNGWIRRLVASGQSLAELARRLGTTYWGARCARRKALAELKAHLPEKMN